MPDPNRPSLEKTHSAGEGSASRQQLPPSASSKDSASVSATSQSAFAGRRWDDPVKLGPGFAFFGIIMPLVAIIMEFSFDCLQATIMTFNWVIFGGIIPSVFHLVLLLAVPISNWVIVSTRGKKGPSWALLLYRINGVAIGVCLAYSFLFIPLIPLGVMGMGLCGLGLLVFSPFFALYHTIKARRSLEDGRRVRGEDPLILPSSRPYWVGAFLVLALPVVHGAFTGYLAYSARKGAESPRVIPLQLLRQFGSESYLLHRCYAIDPFAHFVGIDLRQNDSRMLFFRVTGEPFNSRPKPKEAFSIRSRNFDAGRGGEQVADRIPGLSLASSRIDGKVFPDALTSYTEWTMVFKNIANDNSEARAIVQLPKDAMVSRLTLWINGEPQETAFGGRSQVRKAYQAIAVQQSRDPVLVTTAGVDRILVQCFPVPPRGEMKIRFGITAPLIPESDGKSEIKLPVVVERNFDVSDDIRHDVWIESADTEATRFKLVRRLSDHELRDAEPLHFTRKESAKTIAEAPDDPNFVIRQAVLRTPIPAPSRIALVIDGSHSMEKQKTALEDIMREHNVAHIGVFFAGDVVESKWDAGSKADWIKGRKFRGGQDNVPALAAAWDYATEADDGVVVWVHGPQPLLLNRIEPLTQRLERDLTPPIVYDVPMEEAPNALLKEWDLPRRIIRPNLPVRGLGVALKQLSGTESEITVHRSRTEKGADLTTVIGDGARHVARLWVGDEVERLEGKGQRDAAIELARKEQLVTRVTGAVVLEQKSQYDAHGLAQVDPRTVPAIPEPGTALLVAFGSVWLCTRRPQRQRTH